MRRLLLTLVPLALLASCSGDPPTAVDGSGDLSLAVVSGDAQVDLAGHELAEPLVVQVSKPGKKAGSFSPAAGVLVNFRVIQGGGTMFAGSALTDKDGLASDFWTLGAEPGLNRVEVRAVESGEKVVYGEFTATGLIVKVLHAEGADLSGNLNTPSNIGTVVGPGLNVVSGTINITDPNIPDDESDAFQFTVPTDLVVTQVDLIISQFQSTGSPGVVARTYSDGWTWPHIDGDTTIANLTGGPLGPGVHNMEVLASFPLNSTGSVSLEWEFRIRTERP